MHYRPGLLVAIAAVALAQSCDSKPPAGPTLPPPPPVAPRALSMALTGPATVAPGGTARYAAREVWTDGSTRDVTDLAHFRSSNETVLTIAPLGVAEGRARGDVQITAWVEAAGPRATMSLIVLPDGTFRLTGSVREPPAFVSNARVEVAAGIGQGQSFLTGFDGSFRLYGLGADSEVRVVHPAYQTAAIQGPFTAHVTRTVVLTRVTPLPQVGGVWSLTITAASHCALPTEARARTYIATISQSGTQFTVTLSGGTFVRLSPAVLLDHFTAWFDGTDVRGYLGDGYLYFGFYYYYPTLIEQLSDTTFYVPTGALVARDVTSNRIDATLDGSISVRTGRPGSFQRPSDCQAANHQAVFTR